jgi:type I restriction enzyme, S subunit
MIHCTWGDICTLEYGKALRDCAKEPCDANRFRVFGTNGPIGWSSKALTDGAGIIVGRKGAYRGVVFWPAPFFVIDTAYYIRPKNDKLVLKWAYYKLLTVNINQIDVGSAIPTTSRNAFYAVSLSIPSCAIQERVAAILSTYDDLIENNQRRIALLEESARLLYREWFVRFRFPGHEHTRIVDGVPEGWMRKPLNQLTSFLKRGITPDYDDEAECLIVNQKCIRDSRINLMLARHQSKEVKPDRLLQFGDVLVNSTGEGTLGRVAQVKMPINNCTVDTHVTIVRPKTGVALHYFGQAIMEWEPRFARMGKGATNQTELSPASIGETEIFMPPHSLMEHFELFAVPIYEQITNLTAQNKNLTTTRDLLLPRLMNGEIAV